MPAAPRSRPRVPPHLEARLVALFASLARITLGLVWLYSAGWKIPTHFRSLERFTRGATGDTQVLAPYGWLVDTVVLPNFTLFGWLTLILEAALGALLVIGLWSRAAALGGFAMTVAITLSVLRIPNEWPHAYFMMAALHLAVFALATSAGGGLDGVRSADTPARWHRSLLAFAGLGLGVGALGFVRAWGTGFSARRGLPIGPRDRDLELTFMTFNRLGALVTFLLGALIAAAIFAPERSRAPLLLAAAAGFGAYGAQVLLQFRRPLQGAATGGVFGSNGCTLSFAMSMALGALVLARHYRAGREAPVSAPEPGA